MFIINTIGRFYLERKGPEYFLTLPAIHQGETTLSFSFEGLERMIALCESALSEGEGFEQACTRGKEKRHGRGRRMIARRGESETQRRRGLRRIGD